ncbi:MAG TPA: RodZ domain-containing protein [Marinobacter sp.]|nr:RodZ domain-containing protein [Marinobacter sp.]
MSNDEHSPTEMAAPVGKQLRRARERLGFGLSDIADRQHLRASIIQAIEDGDYQKIDTELFLKGYVRAYACQVGLDADEVIRDLDAELEPIRRQREQELNAHPLVDIERKKRQKRQVAKVLVALLLIGMIAAGVAYYLSGNAGISATDQQPEAAVTNETAGADEPLDSGIVPNEVPADPPEAIPEEAAPVIPQPEAIETVPADITLPASNEAASADETPPASTESVTSDDMYGQADVESDPLAEPITSGGDTADTVQTLDQALTEQEVFEAEVVDSVNLAIRFRGNCWVQVTDANGNRLASSLQRDGDKLLLTGVAPLRVVIGAVSAVESIEFQGNELDLSEFRTVNNRTEFSLAP